jgi:hypothetical protein
MLDAFDRISRQEDVSGLTLDDLIRPERKRGRRNPS